MPKKGKSYTRKRVEVDFKSFEEREAFEKWLKETGRKAGPYVFSLIKKDMNNERQPLANS
jgi:hypothetical protein